MSIGYKEFFELQEGIYQTKAEAIEKIKQHTRNFAKRQLTYFRSNPDIKPIQTIDEILRDIIDVKIYVYTPFEVIKDRWFARAASRGKTGLAAQMQFHDVNQTAFRHIRPTMDIADVVINGMTTQEYIEDFIHQLIEAITSVTSNKHLSL